MVFFEDNRLVQNVKKHRESLRKRIRDRQFIYENAQKAKKLSKFGEKCLEMLEKTV